MRIKFLGTGTSTGIPEIGCRCDVCTSNDTRNRRLRASVLVTISDVRLLIDCGPDFRQQIMDEPFRPIDGVLLTHEHYDHVGGLDDLRPFSKFGDVDIYSSPITLDALKVRMPYSFSEHKYPGVPSLTLHEVNENNLFQIKGIEIQPIKLMHYRLPILGYRIQNFAYLTDVKTIPEDEYSKLENLDVLVIDALRTSEHIAHFSLNEALEAVSRIMPGKTYLIHLSHQMGLHEEVEKRLPENVFLSYDGLEIEV
ncbi:phosphoribosyl 1,2-cyclic phosphate phosphodiesterase [Dysgonomonas hofstadii]|uniref:Phosphoribosyl 1,2-cyclic phosphate phosphodiesterase n=1 Tax=Dysgonomonas hofstadii TaxID=637886 RepID=A0A840CMF3_9BACT|nr:MBL fold metallo-hydrolase [Dysgonomonas hofstadii]MBB4037227.1 phosphoribosyl 1,2-cyclic phosphate phosphodiesterase [Dysgonomonas hofstadii]